MPWADRLARTCLLVLRWVGAGHRLGGTKTGQGEGLLMRNRWILVVLVVGGAFLASGAGALGSSAVATIGASGAPIPQGTQSNAAYTGSSAGISNVFATTQQMSCYRPEVA